MRLIAQEHTSDRIEFGIIFGTITVLALVAAWVLPVQEILPPCLFRAITGIPCPSCGATRSLALLAHGDVAGSLSFNPLFSLAVMGALFLFLVRLARIPFDRSRIAIIHTRREGTFLRLGITVVFLVNWIYLIFIL